MAINQHREIIKKIDTRIIYTSRMNIRWKLLVKFRDLMFTQNHKTIIYFLNMMYCKSQQNGILDLKKCGKFNSIFF